MATEGARFIPCCVFLRSLSAGSTMRYIYAAERKIGALVVAKKEKMSKRCDYCGADFKTHSPWAKYCKASHRVYAFNKRRMQRLKDLEAKQ